VSLILRVLFLFLFSGVSLMANDNFDSGHVVLPVANPNGGVDHIAVPADTDLGDLHSALSDAGYQHPALDTPVASPTKEGSLEYSEPFRKAARDAVGASRNFTGNESGFATDASGRPGKTQTSIGEGSNTHHLAIVTPAGAEATLHTHPKHTGADEPSDDDIKIAKKGHHTVYIASSGGLFAVDRNGSVTRVFENADWASKTPREPVKK
jgi:hypothetical protein